MTRKARILLVDDSYADRIIVERALEDSRIQCELMAAGHGEQALAILQNTAPYTDAQAYPKPDLILMDINMPVMDGKATLKAIRANQQLCHIPIIMLTTSAREKDIIESYKLGVNAYLTKPVEELAFVDAVRKIEAFWFELVVLPPN